MDATALYSSIPHNDGIGIAEKQLLHKGLNFAFSTKNVPVTKIISATESAIRRGSIRQNTADELRTRINASILSAKVPKSSLTKVEACALNALRKDNSIKILLADKGRCTVILDKKVYDFKVKQLLDDQKTYYV